MYYVVYLPLHRIIYCSYNKQDCDNRYKEIGRDYDEDYEVMTENKFIEQIRNSTLKQIGGYQPEVGSTPINRLKPPKGGTAIQHPTH